MFDELIIAIKKYDLPMKIWVSLATDGALSMTGAVLGLKAHF
jgi:hypothetical protein